MSGMSGQKKLRRLSHEPHKSTSPEPDILLLILTKLSASTSSVSDFICLLVTCKRMNRLAMSAAVLRELSGEAMAVKARRWSESSHRFLRSFNSIASRTAHAGTSLMAKAAMRNHTPSLYSLARIHFNANGKSKDEKDLEYGVVVCARAAYLGSINALHELAHSLLDGYGVSCDVSHERRLLLQAALLELQASKVSVSLATLHCSDATHRFMREWFEMQIVVIRLSCSQG